MVPPSTEKSKWAKTNIIVKSILFLGRQNIPFRGHRDDGSLLDEAADDPVNEGNFRELLRFRLASGDSVLEKHLRETVAKATHISKTVKNPLIDCCKQDREILAIILNSVKKARSCLTKRLTFHTESRFTICSRQSNPRGFRRVY